jgi:predicted dehydrogenase
VIRAAIVGLGRWGRSLVHSVQGRDSSSDDIRFVVAHTRTPAAAQEFCRDHGVVLVDDYEQILRDPDVDAVVLATPHSQHERQVIAAAGAGKHIHVEKPITLDRASAEAAVAAAARAGVMLAVGFCRRFHPSVAAMRRVCGKAGSAVSYQWWRSIPRAPDSSSPPTIGGPLPRRRRAAP